MNPFHGIGPFVKIICTSIKWLDRPELSFFEFDFFQFLID